MKIFEYNILLVLTIKDGYTSLVFPQRGRVDTFPGSFNIADLKLL